MTPRSTTRLKGFPLSDLRPRAVLIATLLVLLGALAVAPYALQYHGGVNDEGILLTAAARMLQGQVPYRDFDMFYTPGSMAATAAWMGVAGTSILSARLFMVLWAGLLTALIFLLSDELLPRRLALAPPTLFMLSGYSEWPVLSYHWAAIMGLVAALWACAVWSRTGRPQWMWASGVFTGLAGACLQPEGFAAFCSVAIALALTRPFPGAALLRFLGGVAVVWVPLLLLMVLLGAGGAMLDDVLLRATRGLYRFRSQPYDVGLLSAQWQGLAAQWPASWDASRLAWAVTSVSMALCWTVKYGLLFPVLAAGVVLAWRRGGAWRGMAVAWVVWTWAKADRLDMLYANYLTPAWYVALVLVLDAVWRRWRAVGLALAGLVAAVFVVSWGTAMVGSRAFAHPIDTPAGRLYASSPEEAQLRQAVFSVASQVAPPGSPAFAWPYASGFYFLSQTRNPTRLDFVLPGQHSRAEVAALARSLQEKRVPYLFHFPLSRQIYEETRAFDPSWFEPEMAWMDAAITDGYEPLGRIGAITIYRLKP